MAKEPQDSEWYGWEMFLAWAEEEGEEIEVRGT